MHAHSVTSNFEIARSARILEPTVCLCTLARPEEMNCTNVTLIRPISAIGPCVAGMSFGCVAGQSAYWVRDGCRGIFRCNGAWGGMCESAARRSARIEHASGA